MKTKQKFVIYKGNTDIHIMTEETESEFIKKAKEWKFDLTDDYDRKVINSESVRVVASVNLLAD